MATPAGSDALPRSEHGALLMTVPTASSPRPTPCDAVPWTQTLPPSSLLWRVLTPRPVRTGCRGSQLPCQEKGAPGHPGVTVGEGCGPTPTPGSLQLLPEGCEDIKCPLPSLQVGTKSGALPTPGSLGMGLRAHCSGGRLLPLPLPSPLFCWLCSPDRDPQTNPCLRLCFWGPRLRTTPCFILGGSGHTGRSHPKTPFMLPPGPLTPPFPDSLQRPACLEGRLKASTGRAGGGCTRSLPERPWKSGSARSLRFTVLRLLADLRLGDGAAQERAHRWHDARSWSPGAVPGPQ